MQCEAKSARNMPANAPRAHTQPAFVFLFHPEKKSTMGKLQPTATWKWKREAFKTVHLEGRGGRGDGGIEERVIQTRDGSRERERKKRGRMKERLILASWKLQTDKQTGSCWR